MVCPGGGFSDQGFQLGKGHFDGVEVWGVGRQEDEVVALGAEQIDDVGRFVGRQVVGHDDMSGPEGGREFVQDVGLEAVAVHRAVEHPGGHQAVAAKAGDKGLGVPVAEGGMVDQARADRGPAGGLDEVGLEAGLVNEDQPFQHVGHVRLEGFNPHPASLGHVGAQDFAGEQSFFYG